MAIPLHITAPLAALTTVFTPPCSTSWLVATTQLPSQFPSFPAPGPATCDPPAWSANLAGRGFQFYSPAICPDGFEVGTSCLVGAPTRTAEDFPAVTDGETAAWCVPSGHTCTSDTTDFRGGVWGVSRTDTDTADKTAVVTVGPALQIRWRDGDLLHLATHPLTPGLTLAVPTTTTTPRASPAPTASSTTSTAVPIPRLTTGNTQTMTASSSDDGDDDDDDDDDKYSTTSTQTYTAATRSTSGNGDRHLTIVPTGTTAPATDTQETTTSTTTSSADATATHDTHETKVATGPSVHRLVISLVVVSLVGVVASGFTLFFFSRRRQRRQHDAENQANPQAPAGGLNSDASGFTAIGTGAWMRTPPSRLAWLRSWAVPTTKRWWGGVQRLAVWPSVFGRRHDAVQDPELDAWQRRQQPLTRIEAEERPSGHNDEHDESDDEKRIRLREEALRRPRTSHDAEDDNDDNKTIDKTLQFDTAVDHRRTSWLERLSRFLQAPSGDGTEIGRSGSRLGDDAEGSQVSRSLDTPTTTTTTTRWSRWTLRTDDGPGLDEAVVVDTAVEQPIPPLPPPQQLRLLLLPPRAGGRTSLSPARQFPEQDDFARLSNGTFGLLASPAREAQPTLPSRRASGQSVTEKE